MKDAMEPPCIYKHTCGHDFCLMQDCIDYHAKKYGDPWYEDASEKYDRENKDAQ